MLVVADNRDHEVCLLVGKDKSFLGKVVHLGLCLLGAVAVHATDPGVARVDRFSTGDLANGLGDFTDPLDAFGNSCAPALLR